MRPEALELTMTPARAVGSSPGTYSPLGCSSSFSICSSPSISCYYSTNIFSFFVSHLSFKSLRSNRSSIDFVAVGAVSTECDFGGKMLPDTAVVESVRMLISINSYIFLGTSISSKSSSISLKWIVAVGGRASLMLLAD